MAALSARLVPPFLLVRLQVAPMRTYQTARNQSASMCFLERLFLPWGNKAACRCGLLMITIVKHDRTSASHGLRRDLIQRKI